jgi:hypothetical protein
MSGAILAIDPGPRRSALLRLRPTLRKVEPIGILENRLIRRELRRLSAGHRDGTLVIEAIAFQGRQAGADTMETALATGRFIETWFRSGHRDAVHRIKRATVCKALGLPGTAGDARVRAELLRRWHPGQGGAGAAPAIGTKAAPGPLYAVKAAGGSHLWAALAVAVAYLERGRKGEIIDRAP